MLPKTFLSTSGTRKRNLGAAKRVRTPSLAHQFRTLNPVEKKKESKQSRNHIEQQHRRIDWPIVKKYEHY